MRRDTLAGWILIHGVARAAALNRPRAGLTTGQRPRPRKEHTNWLRDVTADLFEGAIADDIFADDAGANASTVSGWERARAYNKCAVQYYAPHSGPLPMVDDRAHAVYFISSKAGSSPVRDSIQQGGAAWPGEDNLDYTRFTFVRDPAARLISAFLYKNMMCSGGQGKAKSLDSNATAAMRAQVMVWFEEFVSKLERNAGGPCWEVHIQALRGRLPDPAKYPMDFIGNIASVSKDWPELQKHQQEAFHGTLGHLTEKRRFKASSNQKLVLNVSLVSDDLMARICELYRDDYCCFKHPIPKACSIDCSH